MTRVFCIDVAGGWRWFFVCILLVACSISSAIVLHPDGEPNLAVWTDHPPDAVVGRWSTNASCVAIAPNLILSVKHQGGDIGTDIVLGSTTYKVSQLVNLSVDLRVARITTQAGTAANLTEYALLHTGTNETGNAIVLGGFGRGRNLTLATGGTPYGYTWKNESNLTLRWGTNKIDWLVTGETPPYGITDLLQADFDDLESNIQKPLRAYSSVYEAITAEYDSGGGWFIKNSISGQWDLAGITAYLANSRAESWFRSSTDPTQLMPDIFYGIRISSYDDQITPIINWMSNAVIISGYIYNFQNNPVSGITINSDNGAGYTKTDSNGYYEIWVANGWSGTIIPSFSGSSFDPAGFLYNSITSDINNQNFYIDTIVVSGTVYDNNLPVQNVIIDANSQASTTTDVNGFYQLHLYSGFSGNLAPSKSGYVMTPEFRTYSNITSDLTSQNFDVKAPVLADDFNDNTRSSDWVIKNPNSLATIINETNQRLEISYFGDINPTEAYYAANGWKISSTQNFAIKTDFHNEAITEFLTGVAIRLVDSNSSENYIQFSAVSEANQSKFNVQANINGILTHNSIARDHNDGSLWMSCDSDTNEIYLSSTSFGPEDAFQVVPLPEKIDWIVELVGFTENFDFVTGVAWLDNFTIQMGQLLYWPPKTDINQDGFVDIKDIVDMASQWLSIGGGFSADIDVDGDVDLADFAKFAEVW